MSADLRSLVASLNSSAGALAVLGAVIDARLTGTPLDPRLVPHATEVVNALGASAALEAASDTELRAAMGPIRAFALMNAKLLSASGRVPGWRTSSGQFAAPLTPGGWALLALSRPHSGDPIADPLWDFRIASFGGAAMSSTEGCALLRHAGYTDTRTLLTPPGAVAALVAGRRRGTGR